MWMLDDDFGTDEYVLFKCGDHNFWRCATDSPILSQNDQIAFEFR
jgi:hypothetical protein